MLAPSLLDLRLRLEMGRFGLSPTKPHNSPLITTFYHLAAGFRKPGRDVSGYINRGNLIFPLGTLGGKLAHLEGQAFRACFRDLGRSLSSTILLNLTSAKVLSLVSYMTVIG